MRLFLASMIRTLPGIAAYSASCDWPVRRRAVGLGTVTMEPVSWLRRLKAKGVRLTAERAMQIIESSVVGLRSAVITLKRRGTPLRFVLFPMVHVAAPEFYDAVSARVRECHIVLAEGVKGRSAALSTLTMAYRLARHNPRLGLVLQRIDLEGSAAQVICPDLTGREFSRHWRMVSLRERAMVVCLAPPIGLWLMLAGNREFIGRHLALDDLPTSEQELRDEAADGVTELLTSRRDALLISAAATVHQEHAHEPFDVAVVYGAGHIAPFVRAMSDRFGYRPHGAEWLTVFDYG